MSVEKERWRFFIRGAVQGVGFRPAVYRLATALELTGFVLNSSQGVIIEVEGPLCRLEEFRSRLAAEPPPRAFISATEVTRLDEAGFPNFEVRLSRDEGGKSVLILPDIATCPDCRSEIFDPTDRRHLYPFTNCTNCGPRFSIIESLPYDRERTTMKGFPMCRACAGEYKNPSDRRFHAQPNACPECGPHIELWDAEGSRMEERHDALLQAAAAVRDGKILALKGLGGFHLIADACNQSAVRELRRRKAREEKPLAVIVPSAEEAALICEITDEEMRLLSSPEAPIVLMRKRGEDLAWEVAPDNPFLGLMLPYTPLHHLLMRELSFAVVATSGNLTDEPICTDEREALVRLSGIADLFLTHNRPIARYLDDSVIRVLAGRPSLMRRARGYAPLPVLEGAGKSVVLAVGAHLKNTVALAACGNVILSHHLGDMETPEALDAFRSAVSDLPSLYDARPELVACDLHPDYATTSFAKESGIPLSFVQHHVAHILSCMADNDVTGPVLGVAWDGAGYGSDGSVWGGEFFVNDGRRFIRFAHLRQFRLPGGDASARKPYRSAMGVLFEIFGSNFLIHAPSPLTEGVDKAEIDLISSMLGSGQLCPLTSSAGRLFDAVSAITGIRRISSYEGQAAMALEFAAKEGAPPYDFRVLGDLSPAVVDWEPTIRSILKDVLKGVPPSLVSGRFHATLIEAVVAVARLSGRTRVVISGGCFQNRILVEGAVARLRDEGFTPYWHQRVPPNDGGIAVGQIMAAIGKA